MEVVRHQLLTAVNKRKESYPVFSVQTIFQCNQEIYMENSFFIEGSQLIKAEGMTELERHHFHTFIELMHLGRGHQWHKFSL